MAFVHAKMQDVMHECGLSDLHGSPYDNKFSIFDLEASSINLITIGTNGNITDSSRTNSEWLKERFRTPDYSNLNDGFWGVSLSRESPLRGALQSLPEVLNESLDCRRFSLERMLATNAILVASGGVGDINKTINNEIKLGKTHLCTPGQVVKNSLEYFHRATLSFSSPDIIFSYGNSDSGYSGWRLLYRYYGLENEVMISRGSRRYKFARINRKDLKCILIGWPHPSYHYNKLSCDIFREGFELLGK